MKQQLNTHYANILKKILNNSFQTFEKKNIDYGPAWLIMRFPISYTDQIFIKAKRVATVQQTGEKLVGDNLIDDIIGIFNYAMMGLIKDHHGKNLKPKDSVPELVDWFKDFSETISKELFENIAELNKTWNKVAISYYVSLIIKELSTLRTLEDHIGKKAASEATIVFKKVAKYALIIMILNQDGKDIMK